MAEHGDALIARVYEPRGRRTNAKVSVSDIVRSVEKTNMLERQAQPLQLAGGSLQLPLRAFEIATLRLTFS
jgi:alpha-mannosidase